MLIKVADIRWDTDGEEVDLPVELNVNLDIDKKSDMYEIENGLGDYLSDTYGFTHFGYNYEVLDT